MRGWGKWATGLMATLLAGACGGHEPLGPPLVGGGDGAPSPADAAAIVDAARADAPASDAEAPCPPVTLASGLTVASGLAVYDGQAYWSEPWATDTTGAVFTLSPPVGVVELHADSRGMTGLAVDDSRLYWGFSSIAGSIHAANKDGTGVITQVTVHSAGVAQVVADDTSIYWAQGLGWDANPRQIVRANKSDFSETSLVVAEGQGQVRFAVNATDVYWVQLELSTSPGTSDSMHRVANTGGPPEVVNSSLSQVQMLAADDVHVFWTVGDPFGGVYRLEIDSDEAPARIATTPGANQITLDATAIYWTTGSQVLSLPKHGFHAPRVIADGEDPPTTIAVDDTYVYWTTFWPGHDGLLRRACK